MSEFKEDIKTGDEVYYLNEHKDFWSSFKVKEVDGEVVKNDSMSILKECCFKNLEDSIRELSGE